MIDESMDKEQMAQPEKPWEFRSKPAWQRLLIMTAGVINNFLLALVIYAMIAFVWGDTILPIKNIGNGLVYSEVAKNAGFQNGDVPLTADGKTLYDFSGETIRALAEAREVEVLRNNEVVKLNLPTTSCCNSSEPTNVLPAAVCRLSYKVPSQDMVLPMPECKLETASSP